jgi:predicted transcriptional regulator
MYRANLSHQLFSRYITEVLNAGLIIAKNEDCYLLTKKGRSFLDRFDVYSRRRHQLEQQLNDVNKILTVLKNMVKENFNRDSEREIRE